MKNKIRNFALVAVVFFIACGTPDAAGQESKPSPSPFAEVMQSLLTNMKASTYQHKTEIDEDAGILNCDCSGLIGHILRRHFPEAYLHVDGETRPKRVRPLAANYCETFIAAGKKEGPWKRITKVDDLLPGDILAWKRRKIVDGESTGHVLMIASIPKREESGLFRVRVVDSTRGLHANDTRTKESLGVGSGDMWLSADEDGKLNGFKNSERASLTMKNTLAVGRVTKVVGESTPTHDFDREYIGMKISSAQRLAKKRAVKSRIIEQDGKIFSVTRKVEATRVNFVVEKGNVLRVTRG